MVNMRNTLKREAIIFSTMVIAVFFASKTLVDKQGVDLVEAILTVMESDNVKVKSIDWFVNHSADTERLLEQCRKDSRLQTSKNCRNAQSAYQIYQQIHANKAP